VFFYKQGVDMSKIGRKSKFHNVYGEACKPENRWLDVPATRSAWDGPFMSCGVTTLAIVLEAQGGGSFGVVPLASPGKWGDPKNPVGTVVNGHKQAVLDVQHNPANSRIISSTSEDCNACIWDIPDNASGSLTAPKSTLSGHKKRLGVQQWHPYASFLLATVGNDFALKLWDIENGKNVTVDGLMADIPLNAEWSPDGKSISISSKDKKTRVVDPRSGQTTFSVTTHEGIKGHRVNWINDTTLYTVGLEKGGTGKSRSGKLWDLKKPDAPISEMKCSDGNSILLTFWDDDLKMLYTSGKGEGSINYFEYDSEEAPYMHTLKVQFASNNPMRGICNAPKRILDVSNTEIQRFYRMVSAEKQYVEAISFHVPRRSGSDIFQDDIFPDTYAGKSDVTGAEWLAGKDGKKITLRLEGGFDSSKHIAGEVHFKEQPKTEKELSTLELKEKISELEKRVAYLESEIVKRDLKIKELGGN